MAASNEARKIITEEIANEVAMLLPQSNNRELTLQRLNALTDTEFDELMAKWEKGEDYPYLIAPVGKEESRFNYDTLIDASRKIGYSFNNRIKIFNPDGSSEITNNKPFIIDLPARVQAQLISKKISVPNNNNSVNYYTNQATGSSKGARMSYPEVMYFLSMGLTRSVEECMAFRGGSERGVDLIERSISQLGEVSADVIKPYIGKVGATNMLHQHLFAMGLEDNLFEKHKV